MKIFVFEWVSGGGLVAEPLPPSLAREGDMMLHALLDDLTPLPGVRVLAEVPEAVTGSGATDLVLEPRIRAAQFF